MARFRLIPREEKFYDEFVAVSEELRRGARLLVEMLAPEHPVGDKADEIKEVEHKCDFLTHDIIQRLNRTFVTPIDRGDIHVLVSRLDDVMDHVESAAQRLWLYEIRTPTAELREMAAYLRRATEAVSGAVDAMADRSRPERVRELCSAVKQVEKQNDRLLRRTMAKIFREETDAKALLKWKEIYETVEAAIDLCEDAANVIEGVVLENA